MSQPAALEEARGMPASVQETDAFSGMSGWAILLSMIILSGRVMLMPTPGLRMFNMLTNLRKRKEKRKSITGASGQSANNLLVW